MKSHEMEFNGQRIRYFDAYDENHLEIFKQVQKEDRLCVVAGPTGYGKTTFFDFACASCLSCKVHHLMAYGRRYGLEKPDASADRILNIAQSLSSGERFSVAFYPKAAEIAQEASGDSWHETKETIEHLLKGLSDRGLLSRLAGLELSIEPEFVSIYEGMRRLATEHYWQLLEFAEWDEKTKRAYMDFVMGI